MLLADFIPEFLRLHSKNVASAGYAVARGTGVDHPGIKMKPEAKGLSEKLTVVAFTNTSEPEAKCE